MERGAQIQEQFGQSPIGADAGEDLLVLHLSGHDGVLDALLLEGFDEARQLAEREPVDGDAFVGGCA